MKIKLARKLLGFLLATNFVLPGVISKENAHACDVNTIALQFKEVPMKESFKIHYFSVQTAYGTLGVLGDNAFFVRLLHSIYQSDVSFAEKRRMSEYLIKFRDRSEKRRDLGTVFKFLAEDPELKSFYDFAVSLMDPDGEIIAALDGIKRENVSLRSVQHKKKVHKNRRTSLKQEMREKMRDEYSD